MYYGPFMSPAELDAQDRDDARFHPDPDAGRHHRECCCPRCDPEPEPFPTGEEEATADAARIDLPDPETEPPF